MMTVCCAAESATSCYAAWEILSSKIVPCVNVSLLRRTCRTVTYVAKNAKHTKEHDRMPWNVLEALEWCRLTSNLQ